MTHSKADSADYRLARFIARYSPNIASLARAALAKMRVRLRGSVEMVYDNYNALVVGFSPTERPSHAIFSIVLYPRWVSLAFLQAAGLPDPHRLLLGSGKRVRHIVLGSAADLDKPEIESLIENALRRASVHLDQSHSGRLVIRSISKKQRPRRPASDSAQSRG